MTRLRDLGVTPGMLPTGQHNAITDVVGVRVGQVTLIAGEGALRPGVGPVRTGVTAIVPHAGNLFTEPVAAAVQTINGFGKVTGFEQVRELGLLEAPILLTNTMNVGLVWDAVGTYMVRGNPEIGIEASSLNRVVGETNDAFLNDMQGRHVREEHVWRAIETASDGPVVEGCVGAGTGTVCFGFKGGIGTASRVVLDGTVTVGALVQTNFGARPNLLVLGAPIGRHFTDRLLRGTLAARPDEDSRQAPGQGSVMVVLATDAPASPLLLERMALRATHGLARTGSIGAATSGDFVIAFSTTNQVTQPSARPRAPELSRQTRLMSEDSWTATALFGAVAEAVEEAVLNSLVAAETLVGRDDHVVYALPHGELVELLRYYRRLDDQNKGVTAGPA